jgi:hypothetical protein
MERVNDPLTEETSVNLQEDMNHTESATSCDESHTATATATAIGTTNATSYPQASD